MHSASSQINGNALLPWQRPAMENVLFMSCRHDGLDGESDMYYTNVHASPPEGT